MQSRRSPQRSRLPNAESYCQTLSLQCVVGRQGTADSLVHHSQAVVRERLTIHLGPLTKKPPPMPPATALRDNDDLQKVTQAVRGGIRRQAIGYCERWLFVQQGCPILNTPAQSGNGLQGREFWVVPIGTLLPNFRPQRPPTLGPFSTQVYSKWRGRPA